MARKSKTPQEIFEDKQKKKDKKQLKLDRQIFNFLENLIIFCISESRHVPKESGVQFSVISTEEDEGLCLLFCIDRKKDPLITEGPRPDYLVFYASQKACICTIVEMKGKTENELEHGIDQIKKFKEKLRSEISTHLPGTLSSKIIFQGILLTPYNSQIPRNKIRDEAKKGFIIFPIQYNQKAELFKYTSKEVSLTDKYKHENIKENPKNDEVKFIEKMLMHRTLHQRVKNKTDNESLFSTIDRIGTNIHFALYEEGEYLILKFDNKKCLLAIQEKNGESKKTLELGLQKLGILDTKKVIFEEIPS